MQDGEGYRRCWIEGEDEIKDKGKGIGLRAAKEAWFGLLSVWKVKELVCPCDEVFMCPRGCGVGFCSGACRTAMEGLHRVLCTSATEEMRVLQQSEYWEITRFRLYCYAVARIFATYMTTGSEEDAQQVFGGFHSPEELYSSAVIQREFKRKVKIRVQSIPQLMVAFRCKSPCRYFPRTSCESFPIFRNGHRNCKNICKQKVWWWSLCSANAQQISIPSPIAECVYHVMDSERPEKTKLVQELIGVANFDLSNFEGSALFPTMSKFNHNCNPNVEILAVPETGDTPSAGSKQVLQNRFIARARRKIHVNEEVALSCPSNRRFQ
ncbi:hypothetical protein GUITHDRAFT_109934 [Guillardia theta CCMP2712]|uniref:Uncharacterized protein n=1 Tax=Guillardia theta (strain CCMP2712) TaxID=905079 RepID=L1J6K3_GUITC|nr:hypothetical protein GUITHDRAFT_109934 [Guillardia theta CCMP2712]EKX44151.1 hypothetical protein GUITHDRAFT_109934 [Guillardia theta CCMP2712]|eukprot:XP_005831131.1 hypothetical protein GUITHDRAFT_109934 [Guillardia theta CCMP2712]